MTGARLHLTGIKVRRAGRTILSFHNLQIDSGSFVGILGTNGAGKTTLLKVCCGLIRPDCGTVKFDEKNLTSLSGWSKSNLRKQIGYIPQAADFNAELPFTLREVVAMGRAAVKPLLVPLNRNDYAVVDDWIERLGLSERRDQTFRSLSGGEQQKALVARAMAQQPKILMLDEPCSNLDFNWKYQITEIIDRLYRRRRITVLMVCHETSLLAAGCKRIVLLRDGNILADGDAEEVFASDAPERAFGCRINMLNVGGRRYAINKNQTEDS